MNLLYLIAYGCKNRLNDLMLSWIKRFVKVKDKIIFISSPDYSDNALALSDYIIHNEKYNKYQICWIVNNPSSYGKIGVKNIRFLSKKNRLGLIPINTLKEHLQAKYIFATHSFLIPEEKAQRGQKYILLWHGCGFKKKIGTNYTLFDKALVPGPLFVESKSKYWNVGEEKILDKGYPRYDWMLHPSNMAKDYFSAIKKEYCKVVLWLPTFRNSTSNRDYPENSISQFPIIENTEGWNEINDYLASLNILLVIKLHNSQKAYSIPFEEFSNIIKIDNKELEKNGVKLYEIFPFSDGLITDYSSVSFDYLLVDKPIGYTLDDFAKYKSTRGFIFDNPLSYMPGHHIYNIQDLKVFFTDILSENDMNQQLRYKVRKIAITVNEESYCKQILKELDF